MLVSLQVNDNKSKVFLEFLKDLDFVKIEWSEFSDDAHINMLNERMEEYKKNPDSAVDANVVMQRLREKYGF